MITPPIPPVSLCPRCGKVGRVLIVKGKMTKRRICESCRIEVWDVTGAADQLRLPIETP